MFDIKEELKKLPDRPGCYLMKDKYDNIIYVGKAKVLKNRVRSYFQSSNGHTPKVKRMVPQISHFEYIITDTELEALVLECNLIKKYRPKYNALLKDDKHYPYIKITTGEMFPRIFMTRDLKKDKSKYFGPFTGSYPLNDVLDLINDTWKIRKCSRRFPKELGKGRPCLNFHIGKCCAPCTGTLPESEYKRSINEIIDLLEGRQSFLYERLKKEMLEASDNLLFERAAKIRDKLNGLKQIQEKQKMENANMSDQDIIALARAGNEALVQVFFVRNGKMTGTEYFLLDGVEELSRGSIISEFIKQFYSGTPHIPKELILEAEPDTEEKETLEKWLSELRLTKVVMYMPKKGEKAKLVELAGRNALTMFEQRSEKMRRETERTKGAMSEIASALGLKGEFFRIEAYDISNIQGFESVGSMVVFEGGIAKRSDYRKFRIKYVIGANDYASMEEVITRRFSHAQRERKELSELGKEESEGKFTRMPDLIMMDGGKIQVGAALKILDEMGLNIPVCGMVKDDRHRTRALYYRSDEVKMPLSSEGFKLVTRIQDEVHRFAIEYHRTLREKTIVTSELDSIDGIGKSRRKALFRKFSTIENIKAASVEELSKVDGMNRKVAEAVYQYFNRK